MNTNPRNWAGFTLIEAMVALAIAAILLTVAVPAFQDLVQNNRLVSHTNEFVTALNLARSEAIKRSVPVTIKKTGTYWEEGWQVFTDLNADGVLDDNGDANLCEAGEDCLLLTHKGLPSGYTLRSGTRTRVTYRSDGTAEGFNDTWTFCSPDKNPKRARAIIVSNTGRARAAVDSNGDGIRENGSNNALTCPS